MPLGTPIKTWWHGTKASGWHRKRDGSREQRNGAATEPGGRASVASIVSWIWGVVAGLIGFVGLFMVAGAEDGVFALAGYLLMLFGISYIFYSIKQSGSDR